MTCSTHAKVRNNVHWKHVNGKAFLGEKTTREDVSISLVRIIMNIDGHVERANIMHEK